MTVDTMVSPFDNKSCLAMPPLKEALKGKWERGHYRSFPTCPELQCVCICTPTNLTHTAKFRVTTQKGSVSETRRPVDVGACNIPRWMQVLSIYLMN